MSGKPKLIVGIDPGTTSAFAALDLGKNVVKLWSRRDAGREELVRELREVGGPVIIATDKSVAPDFVLKVATDFNARLFVPRRDMGEGEKKHLTQGMAYGNTHEMDALASALKAYHSVENVLRKVERIVADRGMPEKAAEAQFLALSGVRIEDTVEMFATPAVGAHYAVVGEERTAGSRKVEEELRRKDERIRELLVSVAEVRKSLDRAEEEKRELLQRIDALRRGVMDRVMTDSEVRKRSADAERAKAFARSLLSEVRRLKGIKTSLKRQHDKKEIDLDKLVRDYRDTR